MDTRVCVLLLNPLKDLSFFFLQIWLMSAVALRPPVSLTRPFVDIFCHAEQLQSRPSGYEKLTILIRTQYKYGWSINYLLFM
jgi:hypothetical protein